MTFDPTNVNLAETSEADVVCYYELAGNEYDGGLGVRISALFVIMIVSTFATFFPVVAKRVERFKVPLNVYLFARYFGTGVIVATAFIHLLDPAYGEIGPDTCVGLTGNWAVYSWPPAIVLLSVTCIFLLDLAAERYVEEKYGDVLGPAPRVEDVISTPCPANNGPHAQLDITTLPPALLQVSDIESQRESAGLNKESNEKSETSDASVESQNESVDAEKLAAAEQNAFRQQIAAFLILEFGVIFHSVVIGLNLGVVGSEFSILYPVLVFHQSFEGLGIGARMSAIPFAKGSWLPWLLCTAYGLTTPIAIAIGLGLRTTYDPNSFTANVVSGVLDSVSAGILIFTGLVELLARDFLFDPLRTRDNKRLSYMIACFLLGCGLMALLGKWA